MDHNSISTVWKFKAKSFFIRFSISLPLEINALTRRNSVLWKLECFEVCMYVSTKRRLNAVNDISVLRVT